MQDRATRDGYHHGDLRQALLDAALALLEEGGLPNLSLRKAAKRAGVSPGAPYHHFVSRGALMAAIAQEGFERLAAEMECAGGDDPEAKLRCCGEAYVRFALDHPAHFRVMFRPELSQRDEHPELQAVADATFQRLVDHVRAAQGEGAVPDGRLEAFVMLAWSTAHGLASLLVDGPVACEEFADKVPFSPEELTRLVMRTFSDLLRDAAAVRAETG